MRLFAATYLVPISVWDRGTSLEVVMHPACASLITRCVLSRTPVPVPVSSMSLKTKRGANFHFHFYTSTLSRCFHPDRPGTSYSISSTPSVSHSVGRAVPCLCRVVTLTLEPDLDSKGAHHPTSLSFPPPPCRRPGSQTPSFYPARKPASQIYSSHLDFASSALGLT